MLSADRPLVATSTKAYFSVAQTRAWLEAIAASPMLAQNPALDVVVIPSFPVLAMTAQILSGTQVLWGAQDVAPSEDGAQTGEVRASMLRELGCRFVEVGHAERRADFAETDQVVHAKVGAIVAEGLVPLLCVGENVEVSAAEAAEFCVAQARRAIEGLEVPDLVVAYEPVWAIGAENPAPPAHISQVAEALQSELADEVGRVRVIYGGTAGPGLITQLGPALSGLFLGRRAHNVDGFRQVVEEVQARVTH